MSKIKIYELAKELDKPSKELVVFLNKKDVEAKTHMSTIDEAEADMVRKAFAPKADAEKAEEEKSDAPKKKKIVQSENGYRVCHHVPDPDAFHPVFHHSGCSAGGIPGRFFSSLVRQIFPLLLFRHLPLVQRSKR